MFRKATEKDLDQITELYSDVHTEEEAGNTTIGWIRSIYPTRITVETAFAADDLFVEVDDEKIVAVARINQEQVDVYAEVGIVPCVFNGIEGVQLVCLEKKLECNICE